MRTTTRGKLRDGTRRDLQGGGQGAGARAPERKDDGFRRRGQLRRGLLIDASKQGGPGNVSPGPPCVWQER